MTATTPGPAPITGWDRVAIVGLGAAGAALSFDALQQMAAAIHVRHELVWLFPLVIDGFIAYSVRALVVLRETSFAARLYVWTLFAAATATSIWANALHAVRLNQQQRLDEGLRLGDWTVGALSTVAPLALAGAVHLYILIARRAVPANERGPVATSVRRPDRSPALSRPVPVWQVSVADGTTIPVRRSAAGETRPSGVSSHTADDPTAGRPRTGPRPRHDRANGSDAGRLVPGAQTDPETSAGRSATGPTARSATGAAGGPTERSSARATGGPERDESDSTGEARTGSGPELDRLLPLARDVTRRAGRISRRVVRSGLREQQVQISNERLGALLQALREDSNATTNGEPRVE